MHPESTKWAATEPVHNIRGMLHWDLQEGTSERQAAKTKREVVERALGKA